MTPASKTLKTTTERVSILAQVTRGRITASSRLRPDRCRNISGTGKTELHDVREFAARVVDRQVVAAHQTLECITLTRKLDQPA